MHLLLLDSSDRVCPTTTANFLVAHVHPPLSLSARDVWKRIFHSDVCPLYLLRVLSITKLRRDFLETLDDGSFFSPPTTVGSSLVSTAPFASSPTLTQNATTALVSEPSADTYPSNGGSSYSTAVKPAAPILPSATKTEKFLLTAADQESGSRDERLNSVIQSKYEAGLLKPYNYVKGYARLSRWMDRKLVLLFFPYTHILHTHVSVSVSASVSQESKQQILQPLSVLRPKFRVNEHFIKHSHSFQFPYSSIGRCPIASRSCMVIRSCRFPPFDPLHSIQDLVFIEEAFERMLLDYDRVFSAMGVPACLWRRTGEIYKGNREFSELVGVEGYMLRDVRPFFFGTLTRVILK